VTGVSLLAKLRSFLRNLFSSQSVDADLDREVHSHLSMLIDENIRAGMPPDEAQRAAHMELGGIEQVKEQVREKRIGNWLHSAFSDCHYGVRQLRKNPGFTAVAILTLALGIGATTAIFVVDVVILRPRPYNSPDRLVLVKERIPKVTPDPIPVCAPDVLHFQRENHSFVSLAAFRGDQFDLAGGTEPQHQQRPRILGLRSSVLSATSSSPAWTWRPLLTPMDLSGRIRLRPSMSPCALPTTPLAWLPLCVPPFGPSTRS
jgi:hypothetical protein